MKKIKRKLKEKEDKLTPDHLRQVEVLGLEVENTRLRMLVEEQALRNIHLEQDILKNRAEKQQAETLKRQTEYVHLRSRRSSFIVDLGEIYNFKGKLAYDSDTGEIIREEKGES